MIVWTFVLLLCCPFNVEHRVTFEARTEIACEKMRKVIVAQARSLTLRATVDEQCRRVEPQSTP